MQAECIAVDWGTSNVRLWGIDADGGIAFARSSDQGMGKLVAADYPGVLAELLADTGASEKLDILICGMAGARQGWREAPYLETPADLSKIGIAAVTVDMPGPSYTVRILPGLCQKQAGHEDVMRGEETQLLGLSHLVPDFHGVAILPGTHSKWAVLRGTHVERFSTVMTGELFEVLKTHTVLRHSLNGELDGPERSRGFHAGLDITLKHPEQLSSALFKVRAGGLLAGQTPAYAAGLLSGLLIGAEIGGQKQWLGDGPVPLIGSAKLSALYADALQRLGAKTLMIDATDATLAGLKTAGSHFRTRL